MSFALHLTLVRKINNRLHDWIDVKTFTLIGRVWEYGPNEDPHGKVGDSLKRLRVTVSDIARGVVNAGCEFKACQMYSFTERVTWPTQNLPRVFSVSLIIYIYTPHFICCFHECSTVLRLLCTRAICDLQELCRIYISVIYVSARYCEISMPIYLFIYLYLTLNPAWCKGCTFLLGPARRKIRILSGSPYFCMALRPWSSSSSLYLFLSL